MSGPGGFTCDEVLRRLDDFVDRALGFEEIRRVEEHLADCVACAATARFESSLIARIRARLRRIAVPSGLRESMHIRLTTETLQGDGRDLPSGGP
jgi:anti-sigma factor (TIGR02949 family)